VQSSYQDFAAGEIVSVSLAAGGDISLSRALQQIYPVDESTETPFVWAFDSAPDGTIFASVGSEGRVLRISPTGETTTLFDAPSTVYSVRLGPDGYVYLGVAQDAAIHRVAPDSSTAPGDPWYVAGQRYVWDLAFDRDGRLYAGTGEGGEIHRIDSSGNGGVFYDSSDTHITALAIDMEGNIIAGSEENGYVYRISPQGEPFVLFDSPLQQITGLAVTDRGIFIGGLGKTSNGAAGGGAQRSDTTGQGQAATTIVVGAAAGPAPAGNGDVAGAVYLIHPDGYVDELWSSGTESVHTLLADGDGVLVGTGPEGRLLRIDSIADATIVQDAEAAQVTGLAADSFSAAVLAATSNLGRIYRLSADFHKVGEYISQVKDTQTTSSWGRLRWRGVTPQGTSIRLRTRAGNTESPDDTWSEWSEPYADSRGSQISSPPARFIQWKAELEADTVSATPVLQWVELVYVQRNLRPSVDELRVHPAGIVYRQVTGVDDGMPFAQLPPALEAELSQAQGQAAASFANASARAFMGRPFFILGLRTFSWQASDANGDSLIYTLEIRGESESSWKPVAIDQAETSYTWDTSTVPDGLYVSRVVATDSPSNPAMQALRGSRMSQPFTIDNSPPRVLNLRSTVVPDGVRVTGQASDETSLIRQIEYSIDGKQWRTVLPADTLADADTELIDFVTARLPAGEHTIVVRATDMAYNSGAGQTVVIVR
jgi:sugar lactone lactonase YvrE